MTAVFGWILIIAFFELASLVLLWPGYRVVRRRRPHWRGLRQLYFAATVAFSVALWFLIPPLVHRIFTHTPYGS